MPVANVCRSFKNTASTNQYNILEGVALNAAAGDRTVTLTLAKAWGRVRVDVFLTHSAATTLTCAITTSADGTNYSTPQAADYSSSPATLSDVSFSKSVSGNAQLNFVADVNGAESLKLVFGGASGGASDLINVQVTAIVGGSA